MPIYEYRCDACRVIFQRLVQGFSDPTNLACPRCQTADVQRIVSRVFQLRGEAAHVARIGGDSAFDGVDENDPRAVARWAKELGRTIGEDAGTDWNEMVDEMIDEERADTRAGGSNPGDTDLGWA